MAKAAAKKKAAPALSERTKKIVLGATGGVLVLVCAYWAYYKFTTIPPPDLRNNTPQQAQVVVNYLGDARGLARLPLESQRDYIAKAYTAFNEPESRGAMVQAIGRMSPTEREVFGGVVFEIARVDVMKHAREYNRLPLAQRGAYLDKAIRNFESLRAELSGARVNNTRREDPKGPAAAAATAGMATSSMDVSVPFKQDMPRTSDDLMKVVVTRTNASERAEAKPFIDATAERLKQLKDPSVRARFDAVGMK